MKGLVVSNGEVNDLNQLKYMSKSVDFIISVDGGTNFILNAGIKPDLVVGDLDSIDEDVLNKIKREDIQILKFPSHKDYTDTELALKYLVDRKFEEIILMGVIGTRIDHTLANLHLLYGLFQKGIKGMIINERNTICITDNELEIEKEEGTFVSIIPINPNGAKVSLKGFLYETDRADFYFSSTFGISNEIVEKKGCVKVEDGVCFVIKSKD